MDWSNEQYIRVYTRDTKTWLRLGWEGQAVFMLMLRKVDRSGVLDSIELLEEDVSLVIGMPVDIVKVGMERLIKYGCAKFNGKSVVIPNFLEAQESRKSDKLRQRETRDRRRLEAMLQKVTIESQDVTQESQNVTDSHGSSHGVTTCHNPSLYPMLDPMPLPCCTIPKKEEESKPSVSSSALNEKPKRERKPYSEAFERFWMGYPVRVGKDAAWKAWQARQKSGDLPSVDDLLDTLKDQADWRFQKKARGEFVAEWPNPSTWINQGRWADELAIPKKDSEIKYNADF